eukprot:scaffold118037_cov18-Tisochrysis_lutea.AAC.1
MPQTALHLGSLLLVSLLNKLLAAMMLFWLLPGILYQLHFLPPPGHARCCAAGDEPNIGSKCDPRQSATVSAGVAHWVLKHGICI